MNGEKAKLVLASDPVFVPADSDLEEARRCEVANAVLCRRAEEEATRAKARAMTLEFELDTLKDCEEAGGEDACGECLSCLKAISQSRFDEIQKLRLELEVSRMANHAMRDQRGALALELGQHVYDLHETRRQLQATLDASRALRSGSVELDLGNAASLPSIDLGLDSEPVVPL